MQSLAVGVADSSGLGSLSDSRLSQSTCSLSLTRNGLSTNGRLVGSPGARNAEAQIAKVSVAQPGVTPQQGQNLYKSILVSVTNSFVHTLPNYVAGLEESQIACSISALHSSDCFSFRQLNNRDRTQQVIKASLEKFNITDDPGNYILAQQGPDGQGELSQPNPSSESLIYRIRVELVNLAAV